nr:DNA-directed RNA polymerase subunit alpha C-terminal domain-containing protein [Telmatospirillum sp. J64-1]
MIFSEDIVVPVRKDYEDSLVPCIPIYCLGLSTRSLNALAKNGIRYAGDILSRSREEMKLLEGFGLRAEALLYEKLNELIQEGGTGSTEWSQKKRELAEKYELEIAAAYRNRGLQGVKDLARSTTLTDDAAGEEFCASCRFWVAEGSGQKATHGLCRRHSPVIGRLGGRVWSWPETSAGDWCGDFDRR